MKIYFTRKHCASCGELYDSIARECPNCHKENEDPEAKKFKNFLLVSPLRQLLFLLVGYLGLQVLVTFVAMVARIIFVNGSTLTGEELAKAFSDYINSGDGLFVIYGFAYPLLLLILGLMLWKDWKQVLQSFKKWQSVLFGVAGFFAMLALNILINVIIQLIYQGIGRPFPEGSGANESNIRLMVLAHPVAAYFMLALIGPFCEELCYRVGLFSFVSRFGKIVGYVVATLAFMAIHISWSSIGTAAFELELISMPSYLIGGVLFALLYDKFGFAASYTAHFLNNIVAVTQYLIPR